jgi:hypothetical protein
MVAEKHITVWSHVSSSENIYAGAMILVAEAPDELSGADTNEPKVGRS